jgi:hypothetical protein
MITERGNVAKRENSIVISTLKKNELIIFTTIGRLKGMFLTRYFCIKKFTHFIIAI